MGSRVAALIAAALATGCNYGAGTFHCTNDDQCGVGGRCEIDGLCSLPSARCPSGRVYADLSGAQANQCVGGAPQIDAGALDAPPALDAPVVIDAASSIDASACFGTGLVHVCLDAAPAAPLAPVTAINTDTSPLCAHVVSGGDYCVLAGTTITIDAALRATGTRPLVLLASETITTTALIDVGSHRGANPELGAGADAAACGGGNAPGGDGGGAGGSFAGLGGSGGTPNAGTPASAVDPITTLRGGCAGQDGQGGGKGVRGHGGGAVFLIAGTTIDARGGINAGGEGGTGGANNRVGGGGGGAGGMIGFDAPSITLAGSVVANGGGGGEGAGQNNGGNGGSDATAATSAPGGKGGSNNGGDGGGGSAGGAAGAGGNGSGGGNGQGGGGGGGGGAGLIKLAGGATVTDAQISPAATP